MLNKRIPNKSSGVSKNQCLLENMSFEEEFIYEKNLKARSLKIADEKFVEMYAYNSRTSSAINMEEVGVFEPSLDTKELEISDLKLQLQEVNSELQQLKTQHEVQMKSSSDKDREIEQLKDILQSLKCSAGFTQEHLPKKIKCTTYHEISIETSQSQLQTAYNESEKEDRTAECLQSAAENTLAKHREDVLNIQELWNQATDERSRLKIELKQLQECLDHEKEEINRLRAELTFRKAENDAPKIDKTLEVNKLLDSERAKVKYLENELWKWKEVLSTLKPRGDICHLLSLEAADATAYVKSKMSKLRSILRTEKEKNVALEDEVVRLRIDIEALKMLVLVKNRRVARMFFLHSILIMVVC